MILSPILKNSLDPGEASVIQFALDNTIPLVCIDEVVGRRKARLYDLTVTGSLGIMLRAKKEGVNLNLAGAIDNMKKNGIYLSNEVIKKALIIEKSIKAR